jgi:hypothetical protein
MKLLFDVIITELRTALTARIVREMLDDLSARDVKLIIFGMILTLLILQLVS